MHPTPTTPHKKSRGATKREEKESHIPRQKTKLTCCQNHCQRNHQHQIQNLMPTGQNKLIRRLIKHTVEFSRIRRTHVATQRVPVAWGNWSNLASGSLVRQFLALFRSDPVVSP